MQGLGMSGDDSSSIVQRLFDEGLIRTWYRDQPDGWTLKSGLWSPFYVQLRPLVSRPRLLALIGESMARLISAKCPNATRLLGVAMAGIPIAVATSLSSGIPAAYTRKVNSEDYGEHSAIEGELEERDEIVVVDDVVTRFDSKREAIEQTLTEAARLGINLQCRTVCVVVNRLQLSEAELKAHGVRLHALVDFTADRLDELKLVLADVEFNVLAQYLRDPGKFQSPEIRRELLASL
jgi:orotate phosphoribosyltransferase